MENFFTILRFGALVWTVIGLTIYTVEIDYRCYRYLVIVYDRLCYAVLYNCMFAIFFFLICFANMLFDE